MALPAAEASQCIHRQNPDLYWEFSDILYRNQGQLSMEFMALVAEEIGVDMEDYTSCVENNEMREAVSADFREAQQAGVNSTPTFFVNGQALIGAQPFENFAIVIEGMLAELEAESN